MMWQRLEAQQTWRGEIINKRKDGTYYTAVETITPLVNNLNIITHFVAVQEDITDLKAAEEHTRFLATHDYLTQLPNRYFFRERLQHAIETCQRSEQALAVLFIDLDGFKVINDSLGHSVGDQILQDVAKRLLAIVRQSDTVARIGGDEFMVLMEGFTQVEDVACLGEKILRVFDDTFEINGNRLKLTTSIGVAIFPDDSKDADELIRFADAAMYHAKDQGRNNCQFFSAEIDRQIETRRMLEHDLKAAIDKNQLELYYQPQINALTNTVIGFEALIRWNHPEKGMIPPSDFIPFAEESGLIIEMGTWVMQHVCQQAHAWYLAGYTGLNVSMNISVKQLLHSEFLPTLKAVLEHTQVDPDCITLELTESIMLNQPETALDILTRIKSLGLHISIDDFGTGYSSLQYLRLLPLDELKIDQSFVRDMVHQDGKAIIETICALGLSMELSLIAEGVEDDNVVSQLLALGCHHFQGYLFSKPLPVAEAEAFLHDRT